MARVRGGVEIKRMIDLVLVKSYMLRYVQNVREVIGMGRCLSDHHVVLCKVSGLGSTEKDMLGLLRVRE